MSDVQNFLESLAQRVRTHDVFGEVRVLDGRLRCDARDAAAPAWYAVESDGRDWVVSLSTADRWLSESIETDLLHFGDPLEELIEEELVELGGEGPVPAPKHYRAEDRTYVFRNTVTVSTDRERSLERVALWLLAYQAAFRNLGDMAGGDEE
jgi:hypothetical protein